MSRVSSAVDPGEGQPSDATIVSIAETLVRAAAQAALNKPRTAQPLAVFDAVSLPPLSLIEYARRIFKYFQCSSESAVLSLVYIDRFLQAQPDFTISELNLHRLLLTSAILAAKFFDDVYLFNSYYAQVGGVPLRELNNLEATFLKVVDYRLHVDGEVYNKYYALVHGESCFQVDAGAESTDVDEGESDENSDAMEDVVSTPDLSEPEVQKATSTSSSRLWLDEAAKQLKRMETDADIEHLPSERCEPTCLSEVYAPIRRSTRRRPCSRCTR